MDCRYLLCWAALGILSGFGCNDSAPPAQASDASPAASATMIVRPDWMEHPKTIDRSQWKTISPKGPQQYDTIKVNAKNPTLDLQKVVLLSANRTGAMVFRSGDWRETGETFRGISVRQFELTPARPYDPEIKGRYKSGTLWGMRLYNVADLLLEDGWIHDIQEIYEGHGLYINPCGPLTLRRLVIEDCGGQAIQLMNRQWSEPSENLPFAGGLVHLDTIKIRNCSFNPNRGAFPITMRGLGPNADVLIENVDIYIKWNQPQKRSGRTCRSAGGIVLARPDSKLESYDFDFFRNVTLRNCRVVLIDPFQPVLQVEGCRKLTVENCHFEGGDVRLAPFDRGPGVLRLTWRNNTGNARVQHRGKTLGTADADFHW